MDDDIQRITDITSNLSSSPPDHRLNTLLAIGKPVVDVGERAASAPIASALCCGIALEPVRRPIIQPQMAELVEAAFLER